MKKGEVARNKGLPPTEKQLEALKKNWGSRKGKTQTEEAKLKMSIAKKGKTSPRKGVKLSEETKVKLSIAKKGKPSWNKGLKGYMAGEKHYGWIGDKRDELRLAIDNGVTLCRICHRNFHKIYGTRNNTKEQYEERMLYKEKN